MKLLINGVLQDDLAKLPYSNSLLRGDGLFETILTIDQKVVAWDRHYARLEKSAKQILITLPARIDIEVGIEKILANATGESRLRLNVLADGDWFITLEPVSEGKESISLMKINEPKISKGALSASIHDFSFGVSDRGASIRIPIGAVEKGWKGWLEDRRPNSAADPYKVAARIIKTVKTAKV